MDDVRRPSFAAPRMLDAVDARHRRTHPQVTVSMIRTASACSSGQVRAHGGGSANDFVKKNQEFGGLMDGIVRFWTPTPKGSSRPN